MSDLASFFLPATTSESLASVLFNGFVTIFLLPILLMDLLYFFPLSLLHLLGGRVRPRALAASMGGFCMWLLGIAVAVLVIRMVDAFALELLYRTRSGLLSAAVGAAHAIYCLFRYRKSMRDYYYAHIFEQNLSPAQADACDALRKALQNGELDAKALCEDRSRNYYARRIAHEVLASRQDVPEWSEEVHQSTDIHFL